LTDIQVRNNLAAPHAGKESPLYKMISSKTGMSSENSDHAIEYCDLWSVQWWGFDASAVFLKLSSTQKRSVLQRCNNSLLNEAYFIEKSGLAFCAKMILSSETTDGAQLYALIAADEAKHLAWVEPYLEVAQKQLPSGHFLSFLSNLIENYPPRLLIYLVQIILEGWGLDHYKRLSQGCSDGALARVFSAILKDEALHHKSGCVLFDSSSFSSDDLSLITTALCGYTQMVRVGPQAALTAIDQVAYGLSQQELEEVLVAIRHQSETQRKLSLLQQLMLQSGIEVMVDQLTAADQFVPMSLSQAACAFRSAGQ
jgi:hypothetical protein